MILMFCGPPASGKSEIARRLAERLENSKLVSSEEFKRKTYKHMFAETEKWTGRIKYLILDGTFYRGEWRDRIKSIAEENKQRLFTVYIKCSLQTCLKRNELRKDRIEERAVRIIHGQMEEPRSPDLIIDTDILNVDEAVKAILRTLKNNGKT